MEINILNQNEGAEHKNLFGINVTSLGYCIAKISPAAAAEKPTLDICVYEPWERGAPDEKHIRDKLRTLELSGNPCSTVLDRSDYVLLNVEAPDVPEEEVVSAVRWSIGDMVDFDVSNAIIDVFDSPVVGRQSKQKSIYVVAAPGDKVLVKTSFLQNAQANLSVIDIPELVIRNLATLLPENGKGVALLYMMKRHGLILLVRDSYVYLARKLEVGSADIKSVAEQLTSLEADPSQGLVIRETNPLLEALGLEVLRSIDYYDRYFSLTPLSGLVIMPMENELPGFQESLAKTLGINVRYLDLNDLLDCKVPLSKQMQEHCFLAIGAALRANLEQQEIEQGQKVEQDNELSMEVKG